MNATAPNLNLAASHQIRGAQTTTTTGESTSNHGANQSATTTTTTTTTTNNSNNNINGSSLSDSLTSTDGHRTPNVENLSKTNLYIRGLQANTSDQDLYSMCSRFGQISSTKAILDKTTGCCKGRFSLTSLSLPFVIIITYLHLFELLPTNTRLWLC